MVSALLFLSSIELHIHTHEAAITAEHGAAVSITSMPDSLLSNEQAQEIEVSPDGMLHTHAHMQNFLVIFIFLCTLLTLLHTLSIRIIKNTRSPLTLPFYGTPSLRAPPQ